MPEDPPYIEGLDDEDQPCWDWRGSRQSAGYGTIAFNSRKHIGAHRVSYELFVGSFDPAMSILHSCDRPICVQPCHLRPGTHRDNTADAMERGQWYPGNRKWKRGEEHPRSILTEDDVRLIRTGVLSRSAFAERFGVSYHTIRVIQTGRTWQHVR